MSKYQRTCLVSMSVVMLALTAVNGDARAQSCDVNRDHELMIRDLSVVENCERTTWGPCLGPVSANLDIRPTDGGLNPEGRIQRLKGCEGDICYVYVYAFPGGFVYVVFVVWLRLWYLVFVSVDVVGVL